MEKVCSVCNKCTKRLATKHPRLCINCYRKINTKKYVCGKCGKLCRSNKNNPLCQSCKQYNRPKEVCFSCKKINDVAYRNDNNPYCRICYNKQFRPKHKCKTCGSLEIINGNGLCKKCYKAKEIICIECLKLRPIHTKNVCKNCYNSWRAKHDKSFAVLRRLRYRVRDAFKSYSKTGKIKKADEYGINYEKIIEHLGDCPGKLEEYHIDHIKPVSLFDFTDLAQIKLAFAPENHQWLKKEENLKKSNKYVEC